MKKTTLTKIFGLSGLFLVASFAVAEDQNAKVFDKLDKNQDGVLSAAEASNSSSLSNKWTEIDADGSGAIDRVEFSAFETEEMTDQEKDQSAPKSEQPEQQY